MKLLNVNTEHLFHIPVMGTAFTIDTPIKVARFGISSVVSLCDDELCETMRKHYSKLFGFEYEEITNKEDDFRAKRITAYLNVLDDCVNHQIQRMKLECFGSNGDLDKYFELLPDQSPDKILYESMLKTENGHACMPAFCTVPVRGAEPPKYVIYKIPAYRHEFA